MKKTLLSILPVLVLAACGIFASVIATFFPVYFAARKSPVESIRAL